MSVLEYKSPDARRARPAYSALLHRLAQATTAATLLLVFMGGLVTSHGAGMSVPDWPNSYGYNMFTFPPSKWVGGIFYEHTHRLMGALVGLLAIALVIVAWRVERRAWVRWLSVGVLGAVILQGILGGLRVVLVKLNLAIVHACVAQAFLCTIAFLSVVTSRWWIEGRLDHPDNAKGLPTLLAVCCVVIYLQLIVGALMRHSESGLAVPDFPMHYGQVIPPLDQTSLQAVNEIRTNELHLPQVSLAQIWLHVGHRIGAVIVTILLAWAITKIARKHPEAGLRWPAFALIALLAAQLTLGAMTVLLRKPADVASAHVAVGALTLMTTAVLWFRSLRVYSPLWRSPARYIEVPVTPGNHSNRRPFVTA